MFKYSQNYCRILLQKYSFIKILQLNIFRHVKTKLNDSILTIRHSSVDPLLRFQLY